MINKERVKHLRLELQGLLDSQYALDFLGDLKAQVGNAVFSNNTVTFKVELATIAENGEVLDKATESFKLLAEMNGLKPDDLGKSFKHNEHTFTVCGFNPKSVKYPVIAKREDGRSYKFGLNLVKILLKSEKGE